MVVSECIDVAEIETLARAFYREAQAPGKFDFEVLRSNWDQLIQLGVGKIYCVVDNGELVGIAGALLAPSLYGPGTYCQEAFWYVASDHRRGGAGKMLYRRIEEWARRKNAGFMLMIELSHMPVDYTKLGYRRLEHSWIKELT